jgi:zinc protease
MQAMSATLVPETELGMDLPRFAVEQQVLESGLRLGIETGTARGTVAVVTVLGSGSGADPPDREGLAHLVEHLVYHGHVRDEGPQSERLIRLGAHYNADTSLDTTRFYELAPAAHLPALLQIAGERLQRPLAGVDDDAFERELSIVENELRQRNELGVYGEVVGWIQRALFPAGHAYSRPIGGNTKSLRRLTLADARAFAAAHYRPDNATIVVSGEVGGRGALLHLAAQLPEAVRGRAVAGARRAGGGLQKATTAMPANPPPPSPTAPRPAQTAADTLRAAVALPEIWLAYDLGGGGPGPPEAAVGKILTAPAAEALVRERLLPEPEVLGVDFLVIPLRDRTLLACQIVLEHGRRRAELAAKAQNLIWALWSDEGPPAAVEWEGWRQGTVLDVRQAALTEAMLGAEPLMERALGRALLYQTAGTIDAYDRQLAAIAAVRPADVSSRAFTLLAPERARTLYLEPVAESERPPPGPVGVAGPDNLPIEATPFRAADLGAPPRVASAVELRDARTIVLPNGLTMILVRRPRFPAVTALLGFYGGAAAMPPGVLELVRVVDPQRAGGKRSSALQVVKADGPGFTADLVRTDRRHLSNALFLLADRLRVVAETDWAGILRRAQGRGASTAPPPEEPQAVAVAKLRAALYGDHRYGSRFPPELLRTIDPDVVPASLPLLYSPRNGVLIIAGDIDPDAAARLAAGWFSDWKPHAAKAGPLLTPAVPPPATGRARETVLVTHRPVTSQVEITFACRLAFPMTARMQLAQRMVASLLGSDLHEQIREQAGATYAVESGVAALPGGGAHLSLAMSVDSRRVRQALRALREQIAAIAAGRFDKGALSQARWSLTRQATLRDQTGLEVTERLFRALTLGLSPAALAAETDQLASVGDLDLVRAFTPCLAGPIISLVGDERIIRAEIGEAAPRR